MKISHFIFIAFGALFAFGANAADITVFYSPTCPHCHHAREFISTELIYEYDDLKVSEINVMDADNRQAFVDALYKCGYNRGGVPVLVIGEKCFQGYADTMQSDLRAAVEADLTAEQKSAANANRTSMQQDKNAFISAHSDRLEAISNSDNQKKNK